jgi:hypothetical protein
MRPTKTVLAVVVNTAGLAAFTAGVLDDGRVDRADLRAIGLAVFLGSLIWHLITKARRSEEAVYEAGRQAGYDAGFIDGRRIARPVVVPIGKLARISG